ncbi:MAG: hypothetical protein HN350_11550 [Phycisphaerales bacterium]|nr:hypothetical protein [Phycisphaerales bacterium]
MNKLFDMKKRSKKFWIIWGLLYVLTWMGGSYSHSKDIELEAERVYSTARKSLTLINEKRVEEGLPPEELRLREGGPITRVNWSIPILPCVLLANSDMTIGPLHGEGGIRIVLYYGFGSWYSGVIFGWRS